MDSQVLQYFGIDLNLRRGRDARDLVVVASWSGRDGWGSSRSTVRMLKKKFGENTRPVLPFDLEYETMSATHAPDRLPFRGECP